MGGRVLTMNDDQPEAEALLVRGSRIVAVGSDAGVRELASPDADIIELAGRVTIPGFVDAHAHLELTSTHLAYALQLQSSTYPSLLAICRVLADAASRTPPGQWIVGRADFALQLFVEEHRPLLRGDLDAAVGSHPCVVFSGLHTVTMNTLALREAGLLDGRAKPPKGSVVDVESGRATELWDWLPLPRYGCEATADAIRDLARALWSSRGVTTVAELPFTRDGIHAFQLLHRERALPVRVGMWLHVPRLGSIDELLRVGLETGFGDEWLSLGGIKLFVDGAGFDLSGNEVSDVKWTQEELDEVVHKSHEANLQVWIHTAPTRNGAEMALTAFERALAKSPRKDHRHRIEHVGDLEPQPDLLKRMRSSEIIPVTTPQFTWSYGDQAPESAATPLATLHRLGFRPPGNSDATGTQPEAINPWHSIRCALAHRTRSGNLIYPEERIDLSAALRMFTRDAAYACHMDDRGILGRGKLGDLIVLGEDPFALGEDELPGIPVDLTLVGGEPVAG